MKIISIILLSISVFLSVKHGWDALHMANGPEQEKMVADFGISKTYIPVLGVFSIVVGILLVFPQTFFIGNYLNAFSIVTIMALSLHAGNPKIALIEIPFLALPLLLIWLKYPFKF